MWLCASCTSALGAAWNCCVSEYPIYPSRFAADALITAGLACTKAQKWSVLLSLCPSVCSTMDSLVEDAMLRLKTDTPGLDI